MSPSNINAKQAKDFVDRGAILIDVREAGEFAAERIPSAVNYPLSRLTALPVKAPIVVFHCKSGARTFMNARALGRATDAEAYILAGGIEAWKNAGFPVQRG